MAALEDFWFRLMLDSSDFKKGKDEVNKANKEIQSGLFSTGKVTKEVSNAFKRFTFDLGSFVTAGLSVAAAIGAIKSSFSTFYELDLASRSMNVNAQELDAWGTALQRFGGNTASFEQSIKRLSSTMNITYQGAINLLPLLADPFSHWGREKGIRAGEAAGLDLPLILMLQQGRREVENIIKRQKELGGVTKETTVMTRKFNDQWLVTKLEFRALATTGMAIVLPMLLHVMKAFSTFVSFILDHKQLVVGALIAIGVASLFAFGEFIVATAIVVGLGAAFALLYDDLMNFLDGNDSVIGALLDKWPIVGETIRFVFESIKTTIDLALAAYDRIKSAFEWSDRDGNFRMGDIAFGNKHIEVFKGVNDSATAAMNGYLQGRTIFNNDNDPTKNVTVNINELNVQTQASDPEQVGQAVNKHLTTYMRDALNQYTDAKVI